MIVFCASHLFFWGGGELLFGHCFVVVLLSNRRWGIRFRKFTATFPAGWSPQKVVDAPKNGGCGAAGKESRFQLGGKA